MSQTNVDYAKISEIIQGGIERILNSNPEAFKGYELLLTSEQMYVEKKSTFNYDNLILIVVRFLEASIAFGTTLLPVQITCITAQNDIEKSQKLLLDFALLNNRKRADDGKIIQYYTTPQVVDTFLEIGAGYRANIVMSSSFQISDNILEITKVEIKNKDGVFEEVEALATVYTFSNAPDPQATYQNDSVVTTMMRNGTLIVNFASYSKATFFAKTLRDIAFNFPNNLGINATFDFKFTFSDNQTSPILAMKVVENKTQQEVGDIPFSSYTLTR